MFRSQLLASRPRITTLILGCLALLLVVVIIVFPDQAFQSSLHGLSIWWKLVFPALLPFMIITEIARGLGVLHGLGVLMEPLLRMLFRLPGVGGWVLALGLTAGAPSGAAAVGALRRDKLVTRDEAERLLALSHLLSPVFIVTVVGVGFLHNAKAGLALALLHYGSAVALGAFQRFTYGHQAGERTLTDNRSVLPRSRYPSGLFRTSAAAVVHAQAADGRTFGKLLGDAVGHSVQQLMAIGGLIMSFSVLVQVISLSQAITYVSALLSAAGLGSSQHALQLLSNLLPGLFEAHLGAYALGNATALSDSWQFALLSALFAWGGLSSHAQVKTLTVGTDIRYSAFLRSRLLLAAISCVSTVALWQPVNRWISQMDAPALLPLTVESSRSGNLLSLNLWPLLSPLMMWFSGLILLMLLLSVFIAFLFRDSSHHDDSSNHTY